MIERLNPPPHISSSIFCALTTHSGKVWRISLFKALSLYGVFLSNSVVLCPRLFYWFFFRPLAQDNNKSNLGVFCLLWQCQHRRFSAALGRKQLDPWCGAPQLQDSADGSNPHDLLYTTTHRERKLGKLFWVPIRLSTTIQVFPSNTNNVFTKPITDPTWQQFSIILGPGWLTWW